MSRQINDQNYKTLTSHERFVLLVEAMARRDDAEADRLEATCPQHLYRAEDQAFRDRMRRAHMIASWVALGLEGPLAQIRLVKTLHEHAELFSGPVTRLAQVAFLYGREYGKWEAGAIEAIGAPDLDALEQELESNSELGDQWNELVEAGRETVAGILASLSRRVEKSHRNRIVPQWRSFSAFCRDTLGIEPLAMMKAYGLMANEPEEIFPSQESIANSNDDRGLQWTTRWNRRFNR